MTREKFEQLVREGVETIPVKFRNKLKNVAIVLEEDLSPAKRREMGLAADEILLGLYEGVPQTARGVDYSLVVPDKITIFMKPILAVAGSEEEVKAEVVETVWHEIAHHFGYEEEAVRQREKARRQGKKQYPK